MEETGLAGFLTGKKTMLHKAWSHNSEKQRS